MPDPLATHATPEEDFAALVDALAADPARRYELLTLLQEDHPCFDQRGATTVVRMRGWILAALARNSLPDDALAFVLEELDTGRDAYLVAAAAIALRAHPTPSAAFAPFLMRAIENIRYHDEPVTFEAYGEYATAADAQTAVGEVLNTLAWLGPSAGGVLPEIDALSTAPGVSKRLRLELTRTAEAIRGAGTPEAGVASCCEWPEGIGRARRWLTGRGRPSMASVRFEDQDGASLGFNDVFVGQPSIVAFFYTRCDNPLKCSLTISKLARVQRMLDEQGMAGRVRTVAVTYDPAYDQSDVLRGYAESRAFRMDQGHRMVRATEGMAALQQYFDLGVSYIESIVNRHRIELFILDAEGRVTASFERVRWDEQQVIATVAEVAARPSRPVQARPVASPAAGIVASAGIAFFPKCPVCWAAYMSVFGIAGLERMPYAPWLVPMLVAVLALNVASVWWRSRATGRRTPLFLVLAGALVLMGVRAGVVPPEAAWACVGLTMLGSVMSALDVMRSTGRRFRTFGSFG